MRVTSREWELVAHVADEHWAISRGVVAQRDESVSSAGSDAQTALGFLESSDA